MSAQYNRKDSIVLDMYAYTVSKFKNQWDDCTELHTFHRSCQDLLTHIPREIVSDRDWDNIIYIDYKIFSGCLTCTEQLEDLKRILTNPKSYIHLHLSIEDWYTKNFYTYLKHIRDAIENIDYKKRIDLEILSIGYDIPEDIEINKNIVSYLFSSVKNLNKLEYHHVVDNTKTYIINCLSGNFSMQNLHSNRADLA